MRILIFSDLHGSVTACRRLLDIFDEERCDRMFLLGDFSNYGPRNGVPDDLDAPSIVSLLNSRFDRITAVRGNCDSEVDQMLFQFPMMQDYVVETVAGRRLFLTHGHHYNAQRWPGLHFDALFYGHTHRWQLERVGKGPLICNPGSPTFPKNGNPPTYALLTAENDTLSVQVRRLSDGIVLSELKI